MSSTIQPAPAPTQAGDDSDLRLIGEALDARLTPADDRPPRLLEAMRYAVLGPGKRLRPRIVLLAARAVGGDVSAAATAACAVEFIHAYSLIHDDLPAMDDDDLRRGRPTLHRAFDEATAILAGDALQALAFESAAATTPPAAAARCCGLLAEAVGVGGLVGGQADDLEGVDGVGDDADQRLARLRRVHDRKTGALIRVSAQMGALAGGADDTRVAAIAEFGTALGLLFQVTDDLLDAEGDEAAVGKRVGKDAEQGKLTYPLVLGVAGSRDYAESLARDAEAALADFDEAAEPLRRLARQILRRDR